MQSVYGDGVVALGIGMPRVEEISA